MDSALIQHLTRIAELLQKYGLPQAEVVSDILKDLQATSPATTRLAGVDMWGGSGAIWETALPENAGREDEIALREEIIRISHEMDRLGIGTTRSRSIREIYQTWKNNGVYPWR